MLRKRHWRLLLLLLRCGSLLQHRDEPWVCRAKLFQGERLESHAYLLMVQERAELLLLLLLRGLPRHLLPLLLLTWHSPLLLRPHCS